MRERGFGSTGIGENLDFEDVSWESPNVSAQWGADKVGKMTELRLLRLVESTRRDVETLCPFLS